MSQLPQPFQDIAWYRATRLTERLELLRARPGVEYDPAISDRRMRLWRSQSPFESNACFADRLRADGATEHEFQRALGIPTEALGMGGVPPGWLRALSEAFSDLQIRDVAPLLPETFRGVALAGFLNAVAPLIVNGRDRLREGIQTLRRSAPVCPFAPDAIEASLVGGLAGTLLRMVSRTLVLELNLARVNGALEGATSEERFASFVDGLGRSERALQVLIDYPVLARQVTTCVTNWVAGSLEFLRHLCADWQALQVSCALDHDPGPLTAMETNLGDRHGGGRAVLRAIFESGFQVVYKPRSLALDAHFQELLCWLNDRGQQPSLQTLRVLDRGDHGWVQFVPRATCTSPAQVRRFFERMGSYLALLYVLEATDFHHENLVAHGEHPMLLDLEGLFHPRIERPDEDVAARTATEMLAHSVMRVGLLPERVWSGEADQGIDISGLGAVEGQRSPGPVPQWEGAGTDAMRFVRRHVTLPGTGNRPLLNGVEVDVLAHGHAVEAGFTNTYDLLLAHRAELLSSDGPLARFAHDEVRAILRPTRIYTKVLEESFHPDLLREALDRERFLDRLWVGIEDSPHLAHVIRAEREDLDNVDIPRFTTRPGSRDLWSSAQERTADFLEEPPLASVRRRVEALSRQDRDAQRWLVAASFATLSTAGDHTDSAASRKPQPEAHADAGSLLAAARSIGDRLEASALRGPHGVGWIGVARRNEHHWGVAPLGADLYGGLPGVALFLARLGAVTGDDRYTSVARAALATIRRRIESDRGQLRSVGGFSGWSGTIYALSQLATVWDDPTLLADAEAIVDVLPGLIDDDQAFDVIDGAAGCIGGLLALHACKPSWGTLAAAVRCGEHLINHARAMPQGVGWIRNGASAPLAGFAHGAAGIAWALLNLAARTGDGRFRAAAVAAVAYERSLFSPEARNWADMRPSRTSAATGQNGQRSFMTAWCHGASGIGLARLHTLAHLDDVEVLDEIEAALATTVAQGSAGSHCLCHGELGHLELLWQASQVLGDPRWSAALDARAGVAVYDVLNHRHVCGSPTGVETPGLMAGLAGIGYGLLRLAQPARVPSVLLLES